MFILGLIFGAIIIFCLTYASLKKISVRWWEWILGILGIALLYFAILNFDGGLYEQTTQAACCAYQRYFVKHFAIVFVAQANY